jgi:DNA-binding transcriptional regulator YdaS (Cro superfamily)
MDAPTTPIERAIAACGSVKALAERIGVRPQAISQWRRPPAERVLQIEAASGIPRHELRPDLWGAPSTDQAAA